MEAVVGITNSNKPLVGSNIENVLELLDTMPDKIGKYFRYIISNLIKMG